MRGTRKKPLQKVAPPAICAQVSGHIELKAQADGTIAAWFDGYSVELGKFSAAAADRARSLSAGLPLASVAAGSTVDKEIEVLMRRLARRGLLEYRLAFSNKDQIVIEPQVPDYWPQMPELGSADKIVLSRFAYLRRRGNEMVLESPRAAALFRICDPHIAATLAALSTPRKISSLRRSGDFPGIEFLALLVDCQILFKLDAESDTGLRAREGDSNLVLWDFHDLLFHTRSTEGRQANPLGGLYPYAGVIPPLPALRRRWPGRKIDLCKFSPAPTEPASRFVRLLRDRHSVRDFDDEKPITLAELAQFLDSTARVLSKWNTRPDFDGDGPRITYTTRPYPSAGSAYELELYLAVANCADLARGFYHYDAGGHALVPIPAPVPQLEALFSAAQFAMDAPGAPQILITIAARFGRISWKYSSIAYSLILKDVGGLMQTFYLAATDMGLGGCAVGTTNIDLFARMTGLEFHVEGPVGQFALGRGRPREPSG